MEVKEHGQPKEFHAWGGSKCLRKYIYTQVKENLCCNLFFSYSVRKLFFKHFSRQSKHTNMLIKHPFW